MCHTETYYTIICFLLHRDGKLSVSHSIQLFFNKMVFINTFFIELDLAKRMAHTKITFLWIHQNCTSLSLYLGAACGFGMICFILKFCLIQSIFHKSYISAYVYYGFLEIYNVLFDVGLVFHKLSLIMLKNGL
jgi:hypothetical protein